MTKQRTPERRSTLDKDEMLGVVWRIADGQTIGEALRPIRGADRSTFFRTMAKSPQWRGIVERMKPQLAWAAVDDWREAAADCLAANPASPAAVQAYGKATLATARALDPHAWAEKPTDAPRVALVVETNLNFDVVKKFEALMKDVTPSTLPAGPQNAGVIAEPVGHPAELLDE